MHGHMRERLQEPGNEKASTASPQVFPEDGAGKEMKHGKKELRRMFMDHRFEDNFKT